MPQNKESDNHSINLWQTETLRTTAFVSALIDEQTWWIDLLKENPEKRTWQKKDGLQQEEGSFGGGKLTLGIQPFRIDWLLNSTDESRQEETNFPIIGPFAETLNKFLGLVLSWFELKTCPPVMRLAFGAILLQPVKDLHTGYIEISKYLPDVKFISEGSSDFLFQISRPRVSISSIKGLRINRLTKWSVASINALQFSLSSPPLKYREGLKSFACRLELDINTAQDFKGELNREQLPQIFKELVEIGKEISIKGDIP